MQILIKSFFRPYLLDRCLYSIHQFVVDLDQHELIVLDDGTPQKYLNKIANKYPKIKIISSQFAEEKITKICQHLSNENPYLDRRIPTDLWSDAVKASSDYLILTEDDVWFTNKFDFSYYANEMRNYDIHLLKLGNSGDEFNYTINKKLTSQIMYHNPKYILKNKKFYNLIFNNSFNLETLLIKGKLINANWKKQIWLMYNIPMGMYKKDYLNYLWKDKYKRVNEALQLRNAIFWDLQIKGRNKYTYLKDEVMRTTFVSSASFNNTNEFDLIKFNFLINELWLKGEFDSMENFPNDFSEDYIFNILKNNESIEFAQQWLNWSLKFSKSFISSK